MSATSRACRARGIRRTTRHTDKRAALYTAVADRRPTNQVSAWQAERGCRPTRATSSRKCRACRACRRECHARILRGVCFRGMRALRPMGCRCAEHGIHRRWTIDQLDRPDHITSPSVQSQMSATRRRTIAACVLCIQQASTVSPIWIRLFTTRVVHTTEDTTEQD